jgi:hypothetical protein
MNPEGGNSGDTPGGEPETGPAIRVLAEQEYDTSPDFIGRVRRKIYRRMAASQFASYSWHLPKVILMELAGLLRHFVKSSGTNKES